MKYLFLLLVLISILFANKQIPLTTIKLQLQWKHQFEFAGFYAAKEKGYYKDVGLNVKLLEYKNGENIINKVLNDKVQYGTTYSSLISNYLEGKPLIFLANFFKYSPLVIIAQEDIKTPADLKYKKIMGISNTIDNITLISMLHKFDISLNDIKYIPTSFKIKDFIDKKIDAMSVFTTNELFQLNEKSIKYNIFDPTVYGSKYYDLNLFTSQKELNNHPQRVKVFREASIKGWEYALNHQDEIIKLILKKYNTQHKSKQALSFEAKQIYQIMLPKLYKIGSIDKYRVQLIADDFQASGFINKNINYDLDKFIFKNTKTIHLTYKEKEFIKTHKTITLGTGDSWAPYNFKNSDSTLSGYDQDILNKINEVTGANFVLKEGNWVEIQQLAKEKKLDGLSTLTMTHNRQKFLNFSDIYISLKKNVMVKERNPLNIHSEKDLDGKTIVITKGNQADEKAAQKFINSKIIYANNSLDMLKEVIYGNADATFGNGATEYLLSQKGLPYMSNAFSLKNSLKLRFAVRKDWPEAISIINKGLNTISKYDKNRLKLKWFTNNKNNSENNSENNNIQLTKKELLYLKTKKVFKICVDPNWMPLEAIRKEKYIGLGSQYMTIVSKKLHTPFKLVITNSWQESVENIKNKVCDILPMASKTQSRIKYTNFTTSYLDTPIVIATKSDMPFISDIKKILQKKLGVVKEYSVIEQLKLKYPHINLIEVNSLEDGLKKVENGELFGFLDNAIVINNIIQKDYIGILSISGRFEEYEHLAMASRNDEFVLNILLQKVLNSIPESTKNKLLEKYITTSHIQTTDYILIWKIIVVFIIILISILFWTRKLSFLNKQLKIEKQKALEATKSKSDFLANMSHEIRTPMNAIIGMSHLALKDNKNIEQINYIIKIKQSANLLLNIINDILNISKLEAGKLKLDKTNFSLNELIKLVTNIIQHKLDEKKIQFIINNNTTNDIYYGDNIRISQILINLLNNAIKFTHKGSVELSINEALNNRIIFSIKDTGIGLKQEQIDILFKQFSQANSKIMRKYGGTGLGLHISQSLVNLMNGKISVTSKINKGSTFKANIHLDKSNQLHIPMNNNKTNIIDMEYQILQLPNFKILLVEDNTINQEIIIKLLDFHNISIIIASNGQEAVNIFSKTPDSFNLIFMDLQMPIMDGITASEIIRSKNSNIPIVILTANVMNNLKLTNKELNISDIIHKPINIETLYQIILKNIQYTNINIILDKKSALSYLNNDKKLYMNILQKFLDRYQSFDAQEYTNEEFKIFTHTIKGLSKTIGAKSLYEISHKLDVTQDKNILNEFKEELNKVLNYIKSLNI